MGRNSTSNWKNTSGSSATYNDTNPGDSVVFDNTAQVFGVTLNSHVNPSAVLFANSSPNNYDLNGSGGIDSATSGVAINGGGTVTFDNNNAYSSATTVTNGSTLIVNGNLLASSVIVNGSLIGGSGTLGGSLGLSNAYQPDRRQQPDGQWGDYRRQRDFHDPGKRSARRQRRRDDQPRAHS